MTVRPTLRCMREDLHLPLPPITFGCAPDGWFPESSLPERELMPAEQVWSNLMDPTAAAWLLTRDD